MTAVPTPVPSRRNPAPSGSGRSSKSGEMRQGRGADCSPDRRPHVSTPHELADVLDGLGR